MRVLITGGAGFIGSNLAARHLADGDSVVVFDSLVRRGTTANRDWLATLGGDLRLVFGDIADFSSLARAARGANRIYHLAAQVAVTDSVADPRHDFEANALGTFNLLEAARLSAPEAVVLYSSTNKVYGGMEEVPIRLVGRRYDYDDLPQGVSEECPLDFHSPYGCSKGAGDQYVRDYARIYGLRTVVLRQSCIYGPRQFGNEDQGWVAHFLISALIGAPVTIYGDGCQVRDVLYVDDLLDAYELACRRAIDHPGAVYNLGGGPANAVSLYDCLEIIAALFGSPIEIAYGPWRPGDQRVYVSDVRRARAELGWEPRIGVKDGLGRLFGWASGHIDELRRVATPAPTGRMPS